MQGIIFAFALLMLAAQSAPRTARDYYNELYAAGGLDRMADEYVCFDEDPTNENFFIFSQSKTLRDFLIADGTFSKFTKAQQDRLKKDWLAVHGYAKGVPIGDEEYYDKDGDTWVGEIVKLDTANLLRMRFTISWQTLRYKRSVEMLKPDKTYRSELAHFGKCEVVKPDVRQTANP
jgi:hypothetical protein